MVLVALVLLDEAAFVERLRHPRAHLVQVKRLGDVVERAHLEAGDGTLDLGDGRHDDHRGLRPAGDHLAQQGDAVHLRHPQVGNEQRHRLLFELGEGLDARPRFAALKPLSFEQADQHTAQARLVVDDETAHSAEWRHCR